MSSSNTQLPSMRSPFLIATGGLLSLACAMGIGRFVYTPILPFMVEANVLDMNAAGLVATANFLGYLAGALIASSGALPGSRRNWFLISLLISALTTAAMGGYSYIASQGFQAAVPNVISFSLLRFLGGMVSAFVMVFASSVVLDALNRLQRPALSALHFAGVGCGIALSALLIDGLSATGAGWPVLWLVSAAICLLFLLLIVFLVPSGTERVSTPASSATHASPTARPKPSGELIRLVAAYGLFGFGYVITATFISVIARAQQGDAAPQPIWLIVGLTAAPSVYLWSRIANKTGATRAFALACIIEAIGVGFSVMNFGQTAIILSAALLGGTFMGITALGLIVARNLSKGDARRILGIMTASFGLGQAVGPWLAGFLHEKTGSFDVITLCSAAALVSAAALTLWPFRSRKTL